MKKRFLQLLTDNFITGTIVILPLILTIWILRFIILKLNSVLLNPIINYLTPYFRAELYRIILAKTLIFIIAVLSIAVIGLATRIFVVRRAILIFERILSRLPMVNKIYSAIKEISNAFLDKRKNIFKQVVLIEYPRKGIYSIAFITSEAGTGADRAIQKDLISVYVPTAPNPTTGVFLLVPKDEITPLDMTVEEGLKMVISAGIISKPGEKIKNGNIKNSSDTA